MRIVPRPMMFRRPLLTALLGSLVLAPSLPASTHPSAESEVVLKTKIVAATVYSDRAHVTRHGTVELKPGLYTLLCDDLPRGFAESSLQVEGRGTAAARILGVDIARVPGVATDSPRYRELKDKLDKLQARSDSLRIVFNATSGSNDFLNDYAKFPFSKTDAKSSTDIFRVQDWKTVMDFIGTERVKTAQKADAVNKEIKKIDGQIEWINRQLVDMRTKDDWTKRVVIDCEIDSPGELQLDLTYNVGGATWNPEYMLRFDAGTETLELAYNARIRQQTGEDWQEVAAQLSTAQPQLGAAPPDIQPYYLTRIVRPVREVAEAIALKSGVVRTGDELHVRGGRKEEPTVMPAPEEVEAERPEAGIASTSFAANFAIPKPIDLPTGSDPRRVLILEEKLTGKLSRYTAPRLSQNVFVKADIANTLEVPLLDGIADVYIESTPTGGGNRMSNFVGKEPLKPVAPGQEFAVHLGVDQDVKVTYKLERKEYVAREGATTRKIRYHFLMTLESFKKGVADIVVQDRIPVSMMKEIRVTDVDLEPKPTGQREDGILTWSLSAAPREKREIRIAYTIEFPGDWPEYVVNVE
jgi:uncharacterized protein (TIGR02231 family)